uniref:Inositol polyphosphate-related phosphatase domain-containing protein n=1 Tax=Chlamydomonas leiostraca TaxID=1034604 RepID=A0A7S0RWX6_9CHLO|mmetsp:Transcript_32320/g.82101  ORF Transcript_32320/g.82101 Transcript_32320/m.82101 type:complete len:991 (+) Transcript_32320:196-3168(+)|eukprot:CAMPEP_0202857658 /NCGR_PEP_ID=MMETSP1391-20130828/514_1 /ASSEMBLY_ACC=CAM_ASM_000867 /TAXON_ID=1034604 /ORGANISM="Chlamydomonas leiostraca, Strain SAG 11-49" /LENGTH=990 /DNA_ID=CAMNT_0049536485 /DNA_START=185 /DNA_END=3157 /DNA_ORIENTATION=-
MKGLLSKIGNKLATVADDIASYNAGAPELSNQSGTGKRPVVASAQQQLTHSDPVLEHLIRNVRSNNVRRHFFQALKASPATYTQKKDVRVLAASYNTNGKKPPASLDLAAWLGLWAGDWPPGDAEVAGAAKDLPDIVCVGFQEIVPLSAGNVMIGSATHNLEAWDRAIGKFLNGEAWATQEYGPLTADGSIQRDPSSAVISQLDQGWSGQQQGGSGGGAVASSGGAAAAAASAPGPHVPATFKQVACKQLVGTYISTWVRASLLPHVKGVQVTHVATGFGGYLGNKGAVVVRVQVYDSPIVFVNSHLSAGSQDGDEAKRNADVAEILKRTDFSFNGDAPGAMASPSAFLVSATLGAGHWGPMKGIADHGNAIWMGDLNYRIAPSVLPDEEARKHLRAGRLQPLLEADQLCREMKGGRVFEGWREGPITFAPTFKFKVGTHHYLGEPLPVSASTKSVVADGDAAAAEGTQEGGGGSDDEEGGAEKQRKRTPAWCDRVLWLPLRGELHQLAYSRSEIIASDHKPVCAAFLWQPRHYERRKLESLLEEARRAADREAAAARPRCTLDPIMVECATSGAPLAYGEARTFCVRINNTGPVPGLWHFVPPPSGLGLDDDGPALPPWLTASPPEGMVPAGGSTEVEVTFCVQGGTSVSSVLADDEAASKASSGNAASNSARAQFLELFRIVILRVEDGGDLFLTLQGRYAGSFMGMPLAKLAALGAAPAARDAAQDAQALITSSGSAAAAEDVSKQGPLYTLLTGLGVAKGSVSQLVPKELLHLACWLLQEPARLATAGLIAHSASEVLGVTPGAGVTAGAAVTATGAQFSNSGQPAVMAVTGDTGVWSDTARVRDLVKVLEPLRAVIDQGKGLAEGGAAVTPHTVTALLLAVFAELSQPLIPLTLASACDTKVPSHHHAMSVLAASLNHHELASLNHLLAVATAVTAAQPEAVAGIAATLAAVLMPHVAHGGAAPEAVANRVALMQQLLGVHVAPA